MAGLSPAASTAVSEARAGRGSKLAPAVKQELRSASTSPSSSTAPAASTAPTWSLPTPDLSSISIPGGSPVEKALVVLGILIIGLALYSKVTGKPIFLGLTGLNAPTPAPAPLNPNTVGGNVIPQTIAQRTAVVNPGKVA